MYSNQSVYPASTAYNMSGRAYPDISAVAVDGTSQSSPTTAGIWSLLMDHRLNAGLPNPFNESGDVKNFLDKENELDIDHFMDLMIAAEIYLTHSECETIFNEIDGGEESDGSISMKELQALSSTLPTQTQDS